MIRFKRRALSTIIVLAISAIFGGSGAIACPFLPGPLSTQDGAGSDPGDAGAATLASLPEGITAGHIRCPGEAPMAMVIWTLSLDPEAPFIGVRDAPLFTRLPLNPMIDLAQVGFAADRAFSVFARADRAEEAAAFPEGPDRRAPHRLFGTLCPRDAADPLDCGLAGGRLKARVDLNDSDGDGVLDIARHEVSIVTADRLQVLRFIVPHQPDPVDVVAHWVAAMAIAEFD
ncbi:MAG: hypothetical protein AAF577_16025 [Pseudomonadota bacterium]